jgi:glycosyltransferase involved in cell wall biosynthesis
MKSKPVVTVITNFLNAERFIEEAITSVLEQTYGEWELLLIDDGSTDGSTAIALRYAHRNANKVHYLKHAARQNCGASASRNLGITNARGEYIAFLDADDVWLPEKLEQQVAILDSHPEAVMLYGQTHYWYSWTGNPEDDKRDLIIEPGIQPNTLVEPPSLIVQFLQEEIPIPCPSDILVRRNEITEVGGFEESFRRIFTDQVFYAKLCLKRPVYVSGQRWSRYRKHADSAVSNVKKNGQLRTSRLIYLTWLERYLDDQRVEDRNVRRALRSAKWKCRLPAVFRLQCHLKYRALLIKESLRSTLRQTLPAPLHRVLRGQRPVAVDQPVELPVCSRPNKLSPRVD